MNHNISIIVVGYKDKNIANVVKHIKKATKSNNTVYVFDQHPINHKDDFLEISNCEYEHKIWDDIHGPAYTRSTKVYDTMFDATHVCIVSPDIELSDAWDTTLIDLLERKNVVFSGSGKVSVSHKDLFSLSVKYSEEKTFSLTQMVDRNFVFAKASTFQKIVMPEFLKYYGENEYLSIAFLSAGYDIMSLPTKMYKDNLTRSVENTYHTFSLEHNYNTVVDILKGVGLEKYKMSVNGVRAFLDFHGISSDSVHPLPYQTNDVSYDPYMLEMHKVNAIRFVAGTKAVY